MLFELIIQRLRPYPMQSIQLLSLIALLLFAPLASQACDHTPLQHQHMLDTYLEYPVDHQGILGCAHHQLADGSQLVLIQLAHSSGEILNVVLLLRESELLAKHTAFTVYPEDFVLQIEADKPGFSHYSSPVGWERMYRFDPNQGFVMSKQYDD